MHECLSPPEWRLRHGSPQTGAVGASTPRRTARLAVVTALLLSIPLEARAQAPRSSPPSALQATVSGNLLTLTWLPPSSPPGSYLIEAGSASGLTNIASVVVPATPTGLTTPVPNGTYFIRVRALTQGVASAPSNEVSVTIGCSGAPPAPLGFGVTQGPSGNPVQFTWTPPAASVSGFRLEAGSAPGLANVATVPLAGTASSFLVPNVPPGTYHVRLRAQNACGLSVPSAEVIVTVAGGCVAPGAPTLTAAVNGNLVSLSWTAPAVGTAPVAYTLLAGSTPGASNLATVSMGGATSLQTPVPNGTYYVRVAATNACGTSVSNEATVVVGTTGTPQLTFTITPNPVPFAGVFANCAGATSPNKTWYYNMRITNQGTAPFTIASFTGLVTPPGSAPVVVTHPASTFALAFGGSSIAPQASREGPLCVWGNWEDATLQWTFTDVGGAAFTAPAITFLRP